MPGVDMQPLRGIDWFSHSNRMVGGQPDTRYGFWPNPDGGGPCIVKALQPELTAYADTLLQHERRMLQRLQALNAPVPVCVPEGMAHWVVTRFGGLTVQRLQHPMGFQGLPASQVLRFLEAMSVWIHLLRKLQPLAERGILVVDLYDGNVVVPLTHSTHGQLRLTDPMLIDHAHTLEAGMAMTRPLWVNPRMQRLAPELRSALLDDQAALMKHFAQHGADLPGRTELPGAQQDLNREMWASYQTPQRLQGLLDAGLLSADSAMQFAVGKAMLGLAHRAVGSERQRLEEVLLRMTAARQDQRFDSLAEAAQHLALLVPQLPLVSACSLPTFVASDLVVPAFDSRTGHDLTQAPPQNTHTPTDYGTPWPCGLLALGTFAGVLLSGLW